MSTVHQRLDQLIHKGMTYLHDDTSSALQGIQNKGTFDALTRVANDLPSECYSDARGILRDAQREGISASQVALWAQESRDKYESRNVRQQANEAAQAAYAYSDGSGNYDPYIEYYQQGMFNS